MVYAIQRIFEGLVTQRVLGSSMIAVYRGVMLYGSMFRLLLLG